MRICLVHTDLRLYWNARLQALHNFLHSQQVHLRIVEISGKGSNYWFSEPSDTRAAGGLDWRCLFPDQEMENIPAAQAYRAVREALDDFQPEVVAAGAFAYPSGASALAWCRSHRRGFVLMDSARRADVPRSRWVNAIKRRFYRNVDAALLPSPAWATDYRSWGLPADRLFYGYTAIDNDFFRERATRLRAESVCPSIGGAPFTRRYFLGVGRQIGVKDWLSLVAAYERYRRGASASPDTLDLVLVGDGPERAKLTEYVRDHDVPGVHFLPFLNPDQLCVFYSGATACVLSSLSETWGLVINEAMSSGLPVLVSRGCGCASTLVEEGRNGWTFAPGDGTTLTNLLQRVAAMDESERRSYGAASQERISHWGLDRFVAGAWGAIQACEPVRRGFAAPGDALLLGLWKGRYRPV